MTIADRCDHYNDSTFGRRYPASRFTMVTEQRRPVGYARWVLGNDYRNKTAYYGAYPPGYLDRVMALFPEVGAWDKPLHVFSGSLPASDAYLRLDVNAALRPEFVGSVYDVTSLVSLSRTRGLSFRLILADPPYSAADAEKYETAMVDRRRAMAALAQVTSAGGHLAWLDTCWPIHRKAEWVTVARICITRSTNHRTRDLTIFERRAA